MDLEILEIVSPDPEPLVASEDEWESWPMNCRNFRPGLEDPLVIETHMADLDSRNRGKVLHITEFSDDGSSVCPPPYPRNGAKSFELELFDDHVTEDGLVHYLNAPSDHTCHFRLFFPCSLRGWNSATQNFMRRWYSHYSVPVDVAFTFMSQANLNFKHYTEVVQGSQIMHLYMTCSIHLEPLTQLQYYTHPVRRTHGNNKETSSTPTLYRPAIYIQYHHATRESTILSLDYSPIYDVLRRSCEHAPATKVADDPFVFIVIYLNCLLSSVQTFCETCLAGLDAYEAVIFKGMDPSTAEKSLPLLAKSTRAYHHTHSTLNSIRSNAYQAIKEHRRFALAAELPLHISQLVDGSLEDIATRAARLADELKSYAAMTSSLTDIVLGWSQLRNGLEMRRIAEDNRRQAAATEAIARDAKWDSEIMKTITVVTLVYLPATFVCTLLSMDIFEWPSNSSEGGVRLARSWWLFLAIAVPLSIVTCGLAGAWMLYINRTTMSPSQLTDGDDGKILEVDDDHRSLTVLIEHIAKFRARFSSKRHSEKKD